jgi:antibiotic biosynthesis monooxygenase (ABM) superfamily enzyme
VNVSCASDSRRHHPRPRHKIAALTFLGLLAPVYVIPPVFQAVLPGHRLIGVMLSVASIVLLMTYAIMPALTHAASAWLQSDGQRGHRFDERDDLDGGFTPPASR